MITADKLTRFYGRYEALSQVSFTAQIGEVVGLLGQNGAGKSTLMNILAGCLSPTQGSASIAGFDLDTQAKQARLSLGYLPEVPPLYPEMRVTEYLMFCSELRQVHPADIGRHVQDIIALCGLASVKDQVIASLSKGFRQRTGLAQALCGDPKVLLLDEPTAGFDPAQAVEFRKLIKKLAKDRCILFSSHLLQEVQEVCDRVLIIHRGRLEYSHQLGTQEQITHYRLGIAGAGNRVISPIRQLSSVRRVSVLPANEGKTKLLIETQADLPFTSQLFTLLSGLNTPILELVPLTDSLEALFLRVTGQEGMSA